LSIKLSIKNQNAVAVA